MWPIAILAILALISDAVIHVAALLGFNPQDWIQPQWLALALFYGLFGVLMAIVITREHLRKRRTKSQEVLPPTDTNPLWFKALAYIVMACALITAADLLFRANGGSLSHPAPGVYLADPGHGHPIHQITQDQYDHYRRNDARLVSAFFLIFYLHIAFDFLRAAMSKDTGSAQQTSGRWIYIVWKRSRTETPDITEIR